MNLSTERKSIKTQMEKLNSELKGLREQENDIDLQLLKKLDSEGLKKTANEVASVSIKEETVPDVHDWDALYEHIKQTGDFSLIQRRVRQLHIVSFSNLVRTFPACSHARYVASTTSVHSNYERLNNYE